MFYNGTKILSYGFNFVFCLGNRNAGKSFYFKLLILHRFFKKNKKFILIVRYENEIDSRCYNYFDDVIDFKYKDFKIEFKKGKDKNIFYLKNLKTGNKKEIGIVINLNTGFKKASLSYTEYSTLLFDEFMVPQVKFLKNKDHPFLEVETFLHIYQTIARGGGEVVRNDVQAIFIANAVTLANPYFIYFNLLDTIRYDKQYYIFKEKDIIVELTKNKAVVEKIKKSKFYKTIKNTKYNEFANDNKFYLDNESFIKKTSNSYKPIFKFYVDGRVYSLYTNKKLYIFSNQKNNYKNILGEFAITENDFKPNYLKIDYFKKSETYKNIYELYINNMLYFENFESLNIFKFIYSL